MNALAITTFDGAIAHLGLRLRRQGPEMIGPCPKCGGTDRFAINRKKGVWNCRGCRRGGDAIDLVRHLRGCSFQEALTVLSVAPVHHADHRADGDNVLAAARIWEASSPLGSEAISYFDRRGIDIEAVPERGGLRFHPHCPWKGGTKPCVVGRYTTAIGNQPRGIWRRPLDGDKPRSLGPCTGCVIRLWPEDVIEHGLVLGEGVETVLAAATRIEHRGTLLQPAWASGSAGNMANFPVLSGIEALTLLIDNDVNGVGQRAGEECRARWEAVSAEVILLTPTISGVDFNDVVMR
jgi:phage/plasmid primase-like uncharacterized protein